MQLYFRTSIRRFYLSICCFSWGIWEERVSFTLHIFNENFWHFKLFDRKKGTGNIVWKAALRRQNPCVIARVRKVKKGNNNNKTCSFFACLKKTKTATQTISKCSFIHFQTLYIMQQDLVQKDFEKSVCMKPLQWIKFAAQHIRLKKV